MSIVRAILATGRVGLWVVRRVLLGRKKTPRKKTSSSPALPASFQAIASRAFKTAPKGDVTAGTPAAKRKRGFGRLTLKARAVFGLLVFATAGATITFAAMMVYYTVIFPDPLKVHQTDGGPAIRILARDGSALAERGAARDYVPLAMMAKVMPAAVVATEDARFFEHYGIDPVGMIRAMFANLRAGRFAQGGSTLTQQLAKNLFLSQERTLTRKIAEVGLALWLEVRLTKDEILELYLNRVYFGGGAYGVEAASRRYFDKSARDLDLAEAAVIAGLLKAPTKYSPSTNPGAAIARSRVVLGRMRDAGFIAEADEVHALGEHLTFNAQSTPKSATESGYVVDYILDQMPPILSADDELVVETTLDKELQQRAQAIVSDAIAKKGPALGATQGALAVLDGDGGIRALVGGRDYLESQFNRAVKAKRQPGSSFKPFVYLAALQHGMTPDSVESDRPVTIGNWSPKNDNNQFLGDVTLRRALAQSINTVAVRLNEDAGHGRAVDIARHLGIRSDLHEGPSLALGTSEVTLLEMAGAYTAFANGGDIIEPHVIARVRTKSGRVLFESKAPRLGRIAGINEIGALNDMLNAAVVYGTGRRAALPDHPVGGKTGTTQDFRDAWFIGFTSHLTAAVWIGNDNSKPMNRATGGSLPAEIWKDVMRVAHTGLPPLPLPGTVMSAPQTDAMAAPDGLVVPVVTGSRVPRVVEVRDELPWQNRGRGIAQADGRPASHPSEGIGEDFIAQAISGTGATPEAANRPRSMLEFWNW